MDTLSELNDPLLHDIALPLSGIFHALGFRVEIATNSQAVLGAAAESWGAYGPEFDSRPVQLRIAVRPGQSPGPEPWVRSQRHYFSVVADRDNFGVFDSSTFFGYCFVTAANVADRRWFRFHYLETMVYMLLAQRYVMPVHAACVEKDGVGVLLYGLSGAGKSTLAWACARAGWTYITDDGTWLLPDAEPGMVIGQRRQIRFKPDAPGVFPELQHYARQARPDGKVGFEVPLADFPDVHTAWKSRVGRVVVLERRPQAEASLEPVAGAEVAALLLHDMPSYGPEVRARYEKVVARLVAAPCRRLIYHDLRSAVEMLDGLLRQQF